MLGSQAKANAWEEAEHIARGWEVTEGVICPSFIPLACPYHETTFYLRTNALLVSIHPSILSKTFQSYTPGIFPEVEDGWMPA